MNINIYQHANTTEEYLKKKQKQYQNLVKNTYFETSAYDHNFLNYIKQNHLILKMKRIISKLKIMYI